MPGLVGRIDATSNASLGTGAWAMTGDGTAEGSMSAAIRRRNFIEWPCGGGGRCCDSSSQAGDCLSKFFETNGSERRTRQVGGLPPVGSIGVKGIQGLRVGNPAMDFPFTPK